MVPEKISSEGRGRYSLQVILTFGIPESTASERELTALRVIRAFPSEVSVAQKFRHFRVKFLVGTLAVTTIVFAKFPSTLLFFCNGVNAILHFYMRLHYGLRI